MSYMKRTINHARLVQSDDKNGDVLSPVTPSPFYRCEDRPRHIPVGHPMAIRNVTPISSPAFLPISPLRGELAVRVCTVVVWTGMAAVVLGVLSLVGWM
jgi:hypothetical protein